MVTRNTLRIPVDLEIFWKAEKKKDQVFSLSTKDMHKDKATDISGGGMGIIIKYFLPRGFRIKIALAGGIFGLTRFIRFKGVVCYCNYINHGNYKCGIKFIDPPAIHTLKFNEFKSSYEKRQTPRVTLSE